MEEIKKKYLNRVRRFRKSNINAKTPKKHHTDKI